MMGDREAVRLVPQPLQQVEALAGPRQDHWFVDVGQPHLLQPFGKATQGDVVDAELVEAFAAAAAWGGPPSTTTSDGAYANLRGAPVVGSTSSGPHRLQSRPAIPAWSWQHDHR